MLLEFELSDEGRPAPSRPQAVPLPRSWNVLRNVRSMVDDVLQDHPDVVRQSARLVTSELVENVIKYGKPLPDGSDATVAIRQSDEKIVISSRNGVTSDDHVRRIHDILERLRTRDTQDVYIDAILRSMTVRGQSSSLGLLRIAAEAHFELTATYSDGVLDIVASRGMH